MLRTHPFLRRLLPRLLFQLAPAVVVSAVGVLLLGNLARPTMPAPEAKPAAGTAISAEAVFKPLRQQIAERPPVNQPSAPVAARARAKSVAANPTPQPRKFAATETPHQAVSAAAPLPIVPQAETPAAAAAPGSENAVLAKLRSVTATVEQMPQRAYSAVADWFSTGEPPRPPADIPAQNFQASM